MRRDFDDKMQNTKPKDTSTHSPVASTQKISLSDTRRCMSWIRSHFKNSSLHLGECIPIQNTEITVGEFAISQLLKVPLRLPQTLDRNEQTSTQ